MNAALPLLADEAQPLVLTVVMLQNAPLLRLLQTPADHASLRALAEALPRDVENTRKTVKTLIADGAVQKDDSAQGHGLSLTDFGRSTLQGLDVAEGRVTLPAGHVIRTWAQLQPHPLNPRKDWDSDEAVQALEDMRESILLRGIRLPLEIRRGDTEVDYIISGERRWRALGMAIEQADLPDDHPILCIVKDVDDEQHLVLALEENIQRRQLNHVEEARAYAFLRDVRKWPTDRIADTFGGVSRKHVQNKLRLLEPKNAALCAQVEAGEISYHQALQKMIEPKQPAGAGLFGEIGLPAARKDDDPKPLDLTPKAALIVIELADKCERAPDPFLDGYTRVAEAPQSGEGVRLVERGIVTFRVTRGEAFGKVMLHAANAKTWLTDNGFYEYRGALLHSARAAVVGAVKAAEAEASGLYVTDFLNTPEPEAVAEQPETPSVRVPLPLPPLPPLASPVTAEPEDGDEAFSPEQVVALVEVVLKVAADPHMQNGLAWTTCAVPALAQPLPRSLCWGGFLASGSVYVKGELISAVRYTDGAIDYLNQVGLNPLKDASVLERARTAAGISAEVRAQLYAERLHATDFLNVPEPSAAPRERLQTDKAVPTVQPLSAPAPSDDAVLAHKPTTSSLDLQASGALNQIVSDRLARNRTSGRPHWGTQSAEQVADQLIIAIDSGDFSMACALMGALALQAGHLAAGAHASQALGRHVHSVMEHG